MLEKILQGRYKIIHCLGSGGFSTTFIAVDQQQPDCPEYVIKQLEPQTSGLEELQIARRLFKTEAKVLQQLGKHPQIPQLFDYFEEDQEFYLVQEFIDGRTLNEELIPGKQLCESAVIELLLDVLETLAFVHQHNVIHRDIKPSNLIRRDSDSKIVLIDFGAVKQISTQTISHSELAPLTVAIGTPGYLPSEQACGMPKFNSDIYAVGMIGISALTGLNPARHEFPKDADTGEIRWNHLADVAPELVDILDRMVRYDYRDRYPSVEAVLHDLRNLQASLEENKPQAPLNPLSSAKSTAFLSQPRGYRKDLAPAQQLDPNLERSNEVKKASKVHNSPTLTLVKAPLRVSKSSQCSERLTRRVEQLTLAVKPRSVKVGILSVILAGVGTLFGLSQLRPSPETASQPPTSSVAPVSNARATLNTSQGRDLLTKGDRLREAQQYNEALLVYDQALKLDSNLKSAWWGQCYTLNVLQRYEEALKSCDRAVRLDPNYAEALSSRGYALDAQKRYQDAIATYKQALKIKPNYLEALVNQGATFYNLKQYEQALAAYDKALKIKPDYPEAWNNKGATLTELKKYQAALEACDRAIELQPNYPEAWHNRGIALYKMRRYKEALTSYDKALQLKPDYSVAKENRQQVLQRLNKK